MKIYHLRKNYFWKMHVLVLVAIFLFLVKTGYTQTPQLWGMTYSGGYPLNNSFGTIFKMNMDGSGYTVVHAFNVDGGNPSGNLTKTANNKLFGTKYNGGTFDNGAIFCVDIATNTYTEVYHFNGVNGADPLGTLLYANDGLLYGMSYSGGVFNHGVLFSINPSNLVYTKILDFDSLNGSHPWKSGLMQANNGLIYGTTGSGGVNNKGVMFCFNPVNNAYIKLKDFGLDQGDGNPSSTLIQDGQYLYGSTFKGGNCNYGTVFKYDISNSIFSNVMQFCGSQIDYGMYPLGNIVSDGSGNFFGVTKYMGNNAHGLIYKFSNFAPIHATAFNFNNQIAGNYTGKNPNGGLMRASDGKFYGMTTDGGLYDFGTIYRFDPNTNTFSKIHDFNSTDGTNPWGELIEVPCSSAPSAPGNITVSGGTSYVCPGESRNLSVTASAGNTYNWTVFPGVIINSGQGTNSISVTFTTSFTANSGNIFVTASNPCGTSNAKKRTIYKNIPAAPVSISVSGGNAAVCPGDTRTYTALAIYGMTYNWTSSYGATITSGQGTPAISVTYTSAFSGNFNTISVSNTNACGKGPAKNLTIYRNNPVQPAGISGSSSVCSYQSSQYAISAVANATGYSWSWPSGATASLGNGGTSIMVNFGGTGGDISVQSYNACGFSAARTRAVSVTCRGEEENNVQEMNLDIFPNPTNGLATLKFTSKENQGCMIMITDLTGRKLKQELINAQADINEYSLDVNSLVNGIYLVKILTTEGESVKRIIKN